MIVSRYTLSLRHEFRGENKHVCRGRSILAISLLCLFGCTGDYPVNLIIQGLPARPIEAEISAIRVVDGQLLVVLAGTLRPAQLRISPWPWEYLSLPQPDTIRAYPRFSPSGPSYVIELLIDEETVVILGDDTSGALTPIPEWTATIGNQIGSDHSEDRIWVELILESDNQSITAEPGKPVTLSSQGHEWHFLLLGASIPDPDASGSRSHVQKEQAGLSIDWLLYR
jgi:hypothetical protein